MKKAGKSDRELASLFKELEPIQLQQGTAHLLSTFDALSSARSYGMSGPQPISHIEIKAYGELMNEEFLPWEVETLREMDNAYLDESYKIQKAGS